RADRGAAMRCATRDARLRHHRATSLLIALRRKLYRTRSAISGTETRAQLAVSASQRGVDGVCGATDHSLIMKQRDPVSRVVSCVSLGVAMALCACVGSGAPGTDDDDDGGAADAALIASL